MCYFYISLTIRIYACGPKRSLLVGEWLRSPDPFVFASLMQARLKERRVMVFASHMVSQQSVKTVLIGLLDPEDVVLAQNFSQETSQRRENKEAFFPDCVASFMNVKENTKERLLIILGFPDLISQKDNMVNG